MTSKPPPKRSRGRPRGTKPTTLGRIGYEEKVHGPLHRFIKQHIANDPKKHGSKARAYSAASVKFGGRDGLGRTTIDRRLEILRKTEPAMTEVYLKFQQFVNEQSPLLERCLAAFTAEEWAEIGKLSQPLIERLLKDREAARPVNAAKTRRK